MRSPKFQTPASRESPNFDDQISSRRFCKLLIRRSLELGCCWLVLFFVSCRPDMENQPKAKPLSESDFFSDQANARPIPPHTVERGGARENTEFYTGLTNGTYITQLPIKLTSE